MTDTNSVILEAANKIQAATTKITSPSTPVNDIGRLAREISTQVTVIKKTLPEGTSEPVPEVKAVAASAGGFKAPPAPPPAVR